MNEDWIEVASTDEIPPGGMKRVEIAGQRYLIAHTEGAYYAVDDQCSHEDISLYLGCIQGDMIKCSLHGSRFSLKTGEAMEEPATEPIGSYAVKCENNRVYINPGQVRI
jgi:3-phenylpropionate/trans-cinnamate dioxygenase ferredoxin subunit